MRIAVTGAGGVLGTALVDLAVHSGHTVVALERAIERDLAVQVPSDEWVSRHTVDLAEYDNLLPIVSGCDALIHLAAYVQPAAAPEPLVHNNNVMASYNALAAAQAADITRVCIASSVNAIGGRYSATPRYDYFPLDESHPCYAEDPYSLSKWLAEQQAAAFARRRPGMSIACLRLHALRDRAFMAAHWAGRTEGGRLDLWGYTPISLAATACLSSLTADFDGAETFYVVANDTPLEVNSQDLRDRYYPTVPIRGDLPGNAAFFDSGKAERLLW